MSMKTVKVSLQGAIRSIGEWARTQDPIAGKLDSFIERWKVFEQEMDTQRTNRNGPLRWEAPIRSVDEREVASSAHVESTGQVQSALTVQSQALVQPQQNIVPPAIRGVSPPAREKSPSNPKDIVPDTEESRAELARYLKEHRREVEDRQEKPRKQSDRITSRRTPKLEKHMMVNPQKLYTPITKLKFDTVVSTEKPKSEGVKPKDAREMITKDVIPQAPGAEAGTKAFIKSTGFHPPALEDMSKRVVTKLAAWSKSLEPPESEPTKPSQPPTVLQVLTSKQSPPRYQTKQKPQTDTTPNMTSDPSPKTGQNPLPSLIERLQASSGDTRPPDQLSPYQIVPYAVKHSLPTPSADAMILPKSKRKIHKPPMSFESSLTSIERRMDLSTTQICPSVSL